MKDCHYCTYAVCKAKDSIKLDCYVRDGSKFDHHVEDPGEAEYCDDYIYNSKFPKN